MKHYLISFITRHHDMAKKIGEYFGKKGQESDIVFYSSVASGDLFLTIDAVNYPEKIKSQIQALAMTDYHVLIVTPDDPFDALLGEMIIALTIYPSAIPIVVLGGISKINSYKVPETKNKLLKILSSTGLQDKVDDIIILEDMNKDLDKLKDKIMDTTLNNHGVDSEDKLKVVIDSVFPVKGIGTVILGIIRQGQLQAGTMVELMDPVNPPKNVVVKSIQIHDVDKKVAYKGDRVGLAIKGVKPEDISRDNLLVQKGSATQSNIVKIKFRLNKFSKKTVSVEDKQLYHVAIDNQIFPANPIKIEGSPEENILKPGEEGVVTFKTDKKFTIIKGNTLGIITILEKFENKLRILGSGPVLN
ncbi:MAG: EF-Tu/IF-2/RF-3 family GTPase [Promethearchaeota archaeon]